MANNIVISVSPMGFTTKLDGRYDKAEKYSKPKTGAAGLLKSIHSALQGIAVHANGGNLLIECSNLHIQKWILDDVSTPPKQYAADVYKIREALDRIPVRVRFKHMRVTSAETKLKHTFAIKGPQGELATDVFAEWGDEDDSE